MISVGIIIVLYPTIIIERTTRKELSIENFKDTMVKALPKWLATINGFFIIYMLWAALSSSYSRSISLIRPPTISEAFRELGWYPILGYLQHCIVADV